MPDSFACFCLEKDRLSVMKIDLESRFWIRKNRLVLVLTELVVGRGQDLKRRFLLAESHFFWMYLQSCCLERETLEKVVVVC